MLKTDDAVQQRDDINVIDFSVFSVRKGLTP